MTERWIYHYSTINIYSPPSEHMNEMAAQGWELVSANAVLEQPERIRHHFYWRKPA
ncbi:hypothetical protein [Amycolatopsis sp. WAC 04182]|uniref:hypothetical protein n=1 Tax=Amycolatopsis sp. WAC 04182 TaxID=2203198 RepID=UPI0013152C9D|nr:hypothetical protein [Amycolatopsis sp. WAC 04182]